MNLSENLPCRKKIGDIEGGVFLRGLDLIPWIVSWDTRKRTQAMLNREKNDVVTDDDGELIMHEVIEHLCVCLGSGLFTWIDR